MDPIIIYPRNNELPEGKTEARILRLKAAHYVLYDDKLYRRGYSMPFLKCIPPTEAKYIMREIYDGIYGNHTGGAVPSIQNPKIGLLLANHKDGLHAVCPKVRQVPTVFTCVESPSRRTYFHDQSMAIHSMGGLT